MAQTTIAVVFSLPLKPTSMEMATSPVIMTLKHGWVVLFWVDWTVMTPALRSVHPTPMEMDFRPVAVIVMILMPSVLQHRRT